MALMRLANRHGRPNVGFVTQFLLRVLRISTTSPLPWTSHKALIADTL